ASGGGAYSRLPLARTAVRGLEHEGPVRRATGRLLRTRGAATVTFAIKGPVDAHRATGPDPAGGRARSILARDERHEEPRPLPDPDHKRPGRLRRLGGWKLAAAAAVAAALAAVLTVG